MATLYEHQEYALGFVTTFKNSLKQYGVVTRNGRKFIRDYNRELKNGKGLNEFDRLKKYYEIVSDNAAIHFENLFN